jgi:hypothetical protein
MTMEWQALKIINIVGITMHRHLMCAGVFSLATNDINHKSLIDKVTIHIKIGHAVCPQVSIVSGCILL